MFELKIDKDIAKVLDNLNDDKIKSEVDKILYNETAKALNELKRITPKSNQTGKHLQDSWKMKKTKYGYSIVNDKHLNDKKKSGLAYLLNNYTKSPHFDFISSWWEAYEKQASKEITNKIIKLIS